MIQQSASAFASWLWLDEARDDDAKLRRRRRCVLYGGVVSINYETPSAWADAVVLKAILRGAWRMLDNCRRIHDVVRREFPAQGRADDERFQNNKTDVDALALEKIQCVPQVVGPGLIPRKTL